MQRCVVMKRLIQRYLLTFEKSRYQPGEAEKLDNSHELRDLITRLQSALRRSEDSKHSADAAPVSGTSSLFNPFTSGMISLINHFTP